MLQTEYGMKSEMILGDEIPEQLFDEVWSVYGDDLAEVRISQGFYLDFHLSVKFQLTFSVQIRRTHTLYREFFVLTQSITHVE